VKKFQSTIIFAAIVIAVCVFAFMELEKGSEEAIDKVYAELLMPEIRIRSLNLISITQNGKETLKIIKENKIWNILIPVEDVADEISVNTFVSSVIDANVQTVTEESGAIQLEKYGLDKPMAEIMFSDESGTNYIFIATSLSSLRK